MVIVDTSVWVLHLNRGNLKLENLLNNAEVTCHPYIVGELACGNLKNRLEILYFLHLLPMATVAEHEEVLQFIEDNKLMGKGLGYIDIHLLVSAKLSQIPIWTLDKKLRRISMDIGVFFN